MPLPVAAAPASRSKAVATSAATPSRVAVERGLSTPSRMTRALRPVLILALGCAALSLGACASVETPGPHAAAPYVNPMDAAMRSGYDGGGHTEKTDTFPLADAFDNAA